MLFERIESEGLAHYSYIFGDGSQAVVIDPRRDCEIYIKKASQAGMRVAYIMETHRNEDYVVGSVELAARTGAEIWHADAQLDYRYGQAVQDGQIWTIERLKVQAIHSPGHTLGSMSYLLHDPDGAPWVVFTGDALFAGEVGRVDFLGMDRAEEMAGLLYDTIFGRFLPLGDEVIVCPAHGTGSVCGSSIAERVWTTIGLERRLNPRLQHREREAFVANAVRELENPPYFRRAEEWNLEGAPLLGGLPVPPPLSPDEFAARAQEAVVLDTRTALAFGAAHVPGAQSIWLAGVPSFGGWFLPFDHPILLITDSNDPSMAVRYLVRLGYDNLAGCLSGGMLAWHKAGRDSGSIQMATPQAHRRRIEGGEERWLLDIRSEEEAAQAPIAGAQHIPITQLQERLGQVPKDRPIAISCGMGLRSMVAASLLRREGWDDLTVITGGLSA